MPCTTADSAAAEEKVGFPKVIEEFNGERGGNGRGDSETTTERERSLLAKLSAAEKKLALAEKKVNLLKPKAIRGKALELLVDRAYRKSEQILSRCENACKSTKTSTSNVDETAATAETAVVAKLLGNLDRIASILTKTSPVQFANGEKEGREHPEASLTENYSKNQTTTTAVYSENESAVQNTVAVPHTLQDRASTKVLTGKEDEELEHVQMCLRQFAARDSIREREYFLLKSKLRELESAQANSNTFLKQTVIKFLRLSRDGTHPQVSQALLPVLLSACEATHEDCSLILGQNSLPQPRTSLLPILQPPTARATARTQVVSSHR